MQLNMIKNDIRYVKLSQISQSEANNLSERPIPPRFPNPRFNLAPPHQNYSPYTQQAIKLLPPITDWPKFSGEGEYYHISFMKYIDHHIISSGLPETIALVRFPRLFEGVALDWFISKRELVGDAPWEDWK